MQTLPNVQSSAIMAKMRRSGKTKSCLHLSTKNPRGGPIDYRSHWNLTCSFDMSSLMTPIDPELVTTGLELPGYRVTRNLGVVRGIVVRSRSILGNIGAGLQMLFGGNITLYTELCEKARADAYQLMLEHASEMGANAVIGVRYDANEVAATVTEVLAYGTAVVVQRSAG
jgi:uncharacterized protein YbjQ (UPF0145 family)